MALYFTVLKPRNDSGAFSTKYSTSDYAVTVDELLADTNFTNTYDSTKNEVRTFNKKNLTKLVNMISNSTEGTIESQVASLTTATEKTPLTATTLRNYGNVKTEGKSIVVRLGGLDWMVTYVSNDKSGNLIATLWLSNNHQETWGWNGTSSTSVDDTVGNNVNIGTYCGLVNGGLYSDWSANWSRDWTEVGGELYPSNLYGTSYIRVDTLNNPQNRYVATDIKTLDKTTWANQNKTIYNKDTKTGHPFALFTVSDYGLTNYITTPSQMAWMEVRESESLPNESTTSDNYSGYTGCYNWIEDYLWLPSYSETGNFGDSDGLWSLNIIERYPRSWSRTGSWDYAYGCWCVVDNAVSDDGADVSGSMEVKPALLLNLTKASKNAVYLPEFNVTVSVSEETASYLDSSGTSYNSQYELAKSKLIVQFCDSETGALVASHTFDKLWGDSTSTTYNEGVTFGALLTKGKYYKVHIIEPTYMRYSVTYCVKPPSENEDGTTSEGQYITPTTSTFTVYFTGEQSLEIEVNGIADNSWLSFFGE